MILVLICTIFILIIKYKCKYNNDRDNNEKLEEINNDSMSKSS